jgi:SAM-dependent methyltransferase
MEQRRTGSASGEAEQAAARVRAAYERRSRRGLGAAYDVWEPSNLFLLQSRERRFLDLLRSADLLPLTGRPVLEVGCGSGGILRDLIRYGARAQDLHGVDLLEERVRSANELTPGAHIEQGDGQSLPYKDAGFEIVLGFTLLSSVIDEGARRRITSEMARVTQPGGVVVLYDFRMNPVNPDTRPLRRSDVRALFPGCDIDFRGVTLARPLVRALIDAPGGWVACTALETVPFLRTHFLAAVHL